MIKIIIILIKLLFSESKMVPTNLVPHKTLRKNDLTDITLGHPVEL